MIEHYKCCAPVLNARDYHLLLLDKHHNLPEDSNVWYVLMLINAFCTKHP